MAITAEARSELITLVVAMFNAAPGAVILEDLAAARNEGFSLKDIANALANSDQFKAIYPPNAMTNAEFATKLVNSLVGDLVTAENKAAGAAELVAALNAGMSRVDVVFAAVAALQSAPADNADWGAARVAFDNKVEVATYYSVDKGLSANTVAELQAVIENVDNTAASVTAAKAEADGEQTAGQTFTLTVGEDSGSSFTGGSADDTFEAPVLNVSGTLTQTLQNVDSLNGGAGNDTLNATLNSGADVTPSLTAIENINVRSVEDASGLSLAAASGVSNVTVAGSTGTFNLKSAGTVALTVKDQSTAVNVTGASTTAALNLTFNKAGVVASTPTTQTTDINTGATTANISMNQSAVSITTLASLKTANIASTGTNLLTTASAATLETIAVTGTGSVRIFGNQTGLKTLTAEGASIRVEGLDDSFETATTGAGADNITVADATGVKNISTGAGNDTVAITGALSATAVVNLGEGNDKLTLSTAPTAGVTLNGGDGTDTIAMAKATFGTIAAFSTTNLGKITGFEVLEITDVLGTGDSLDVGKISGVTSFVAAAGVTTTETATVSGITSGSSVTLAGAVANNGTLTVTVKDATNAGTQDVLNLVLNKDYTENNDATSTITAVTSNVGAAGVETINVNSTGKASATFAGAAGTKADGVNNTLVLTANDMVSLNVTGNQAFTFATAAAMNKLTTIDASALTAAASIDASLSAVTSPALNIKGSATVGSTLTGGARADTITGGAGADTVNSSAAADTITLGGGNDTYVLAASSHSTISARDVITDFQANTVGQGTGGAATTAGAVATVASRNGDVIDLSISANTAVNVAVFSNASDASTFLQNSAGNTGTANTPAGLDQVNVALDSSTGYLYIDLSDNGIADSVIQLTGVTTITAAAFVV